MALGKLSFEPVNLPEIQRKLNPDFLVGDAARDMMRSAAEYAQQQARADAPKDTGHLASSIAISGEGLSLKVGSSLAYAPVAEFGRRPGARMPPLEPFALAKAISRRGTKGRFFMKKATDKTARHLQTLISRAVAAIERRWAS